MEYDDVPLLMFNRTLDKLNFLRSERGREKIEGERKLHTRATQLAP